MRGIVVLGTDTGVGKTVFSSVLLAALRRREIEVAALKPVETGCDPDPTDAPALAAAAASDAAPDLVCPYRFRLPAAPEAAADAERATIDPQKIIAAAHSLSHGRDPFLVVEAAGGVGTPYGRRLLALDLAPMLDLPVVLVARATLGTVGQTLVALRALHAARIPCTGVVLCRLPGLPPGPEDHTNAPLIEAHAALVPVLGTLPLLEPPAPSPGDADAWRAWCEVHVADLEGSVDVSRVLEGPTPGNTD